MVSSSTVQGDLSSISSSLSKCSSEISNLSSVWKGPSFDSLSTQIENFVSEYTSVLEGEMSAFASACDSYVKYKSAKNNLDNSKRNYDEAVKYNKTADAEHYQSEIDNYRYIIENLKAEIESNLERASATTLTATSISGSVSGSAGISTFSGDGTAVAAGGAQSSSAITQAAMDWAVGIANDDSHGYSQDTREGNPNYDCSSLVIAAWEAAGVPVQEAGASYTGDMIDAFLSTGQFEWIPGCPDGGNLTAGDGSPLQPGDVLLTPGSHTEMYIGNGRNVGAHSNYDGSHGDSSGSEINVQDYSQGRQNWDGVLRYKGA